MPPRSSLKLGAALNENGLDFTLEGAAGVAFPPPASPIHTDGLWRTTCFELFVRPASGSGYFEFNFSPSGAWAAYAFDGYRAEMRPLALPYAPVIRRVDPERWAVTIDLSVLPPRPWRVGLSAVIEEHDGSKSYWALNHPAGAPDFHDPACFALQVPALR